MKCAVEGCTQEAAKDCGFQQIGTVGEMEIKTSGLLCKSCWKQAINGGRKEEPKQEPKKIYCIECGGLGSLDCPLCSGRLCSACLIPHEKRAHNTWLCAVCDKPEKQCCSHLFCAECTVLHKDSCTYSRQKKEQQQPQKEKCAGCGKEFSKLFSKPYCIECFQRRQNQQKEESVKCADCGGTLKTSQLHNTIDAKIYCYPCYLKRQRQQQNQKNPFKGTYTYRMDWEPLIEEIFQRFFGGNAHFYSGSTAGQQQQAKTSGSYTSYLSTEIKEAFKALGIEPVKSVEAIKKAYKALALVKHPDVGGKTEDMVKLNKAKDVAIKWAEGR